MIKKTPLEVIFTVIEERFGIAPQRDEVLSKIVALYVGKSNYISFGKRGYLSEDRRTAPFKNGNSIMIPVSFFEEATGASVTNTEAVMGDDGSLYADLGALCASRGLWHRVEENGLIIFSKENLDGVLDWTKSTQLMRNIPESFIFDDADGEEILSLIKKRYPDCGHPRLIFTEEKLLRIKREIECPQGDRVYKALFSRLKECADRFLDEEPSRHELRDGIRLGYVCQENSRRMLTLALTYNLTGEEKYARRAYREMLYSARFPDFNPFHFLDVGEMCLGLGLSYDWLYGYMTEDERQPIREAIIEKGIYPINEDFLDLPRQRSWNWRGELADNWRFVISGVGVGALAILDEVEGEPLLKSKRAAEQTLYDIRRTLSLFAPFGAYEEGVGYWYYGMKYYCYLMASLLSAVGTDFGYVDVVGMRFTNRFLMAMNGPVSTFDYHDCDMGRSNIPPEMMFLADRLGAPEEAGPRISIILSDEKYDAYRVISDLYAYNPDTMAGIDTNGGSPLDVYLPIAEVASMRSDLGKGAMWLGFHCDDPIGGEGHDHMDSGTFVLDALGESFFFELGRDDYNLPNYLHCYRVREEGHNLLVINPDGGYSLEWGGSARIVRHGFSDASSFAIGDLSNAYRSDFGVIKYERGVALLKKTGVAVIADEAAFEKAADAYWFAHTRAEIEISEDGRRAVLTQNGKRLFARIIRGDGLCFSVMDAVPLPHSPVINGQKANEGIKKLTVEIRGKKEISLLIAFSVNEDFAVEYTPLDKWNNSTR